MINNMEKIIQERYRKPVEEFVRKGLESHEKNNREDYPLHMKQPSD